jgi:LamB porin
MAVTTPYSIQYGTGAASNFSTSLDDPTRFVNSSARFLLTEQVVVQPNERFAIMPIFVYQRIKDGNPQHPWQQWVSFGARPEVFFTKYLSLAFEGGVDHTHSQIADLRRLAAQIHDRSPDWSGKKILQPSCPEGLHDVRELVGWAARIRRRNSLPESNKRPYVRCASGNLVVGD